MSEVPLAIVSEPERPALEIRVNFGVFAGREATPAEVDDLARRLVPLLGRASIVAERRFEVDPRVEASLHQVRVELHAGDPIQEAVAVAERWARDCISDRHAEISPA